MCVLVSLPDILITNVQTSNYYYVFRSCRLYKAALAEISINFTVIGLTGTKFI